MAYSSSPITVERMAEYLRPLADGQIVTYRVEPNKSKWFAYRLREALSILREQPDLMPELRGSEWKVAVTSSREVVAEPQRRTAVEIQVGARRSTPAVMETTIVQSPDALIEEWTRAGQAAGKLYFPNADLSPDDLRTLWEWAQREGVLIFEAAGAITLLPKEGNEETADFAWDPSDLEEWNG